MAHAARTGPNDLGQISSKQVSLLRGKENARPSIRTIAKKVSFAEGDSAARPPLSSSVNTQRRKETVTAGRAFAGTLAAKKTPFNVHCDDRTVASSSTNGETSSRNRLDRGSAPVSVGSTGESLAKGKDRKQLESEGGQQIRSWTKNVQKRSVVASACISEKVARPLPSKIPRRSRSSSVPSERCDPRSGLHPRSSSAESSIRSLDQQRLAATSTRKRAILDRAVARSILKGKSAAKGNVRSTVDVAPPPPTVTFAAPKVTAVRRDEGRSADMKGGSAQPDTFPIELLYHEEYRDDLLSAEFERETRSPALSRNFLAGRMNAEQRRLVVVFMIRLGIHCRYPSYIVYQSVKLFDAAVDRIFVDTAFIQLVALASLWIELKRQEHFHKLPTATTMVALARELYLGREDLLIAYERKILLALDFNVTFADPFTLFTHHLISCRRYVDLSDETAILLYQCGGYAIDATLLDEQFCRTSVILISVTAIELVLGLVLDAVPVNAKPRWLFWRGLLFAAIPRCVQRFQDEEMDRTRIAILRRLLNSGKKHQGFEVVYKKYSRSRYGRVSECFLERVNRLSPTEIFFDY